jgi:hypothetical protein
MTFNIGNQSGGIINNVGGDQYIEGGQDGVAVSREEAGSAAGILRELLAANRSKLSDADRATVQAEASAIQEELGSPEPSPQKVSARLERLTSVLSAAGALGGAGAALLGPLTTIAKWLGPMGTSVLRSLSVG